MYYFFRQSFIDDRKLMILMGTTYYEGKETTEINVKNGVLNDITKYNKPFQLIINEKASSYKKRTLTDMITLSIVSVGPVKLISPKCVGALTKLKVPNVQFLDIEIKASDFELNNYKILKIIGKYDCMDMEKSNIVFKDDGSIFNIKNLVLDYKKIPKDQQLLLLGRDKRETILIHETLRKALEEEQLTGISYETLNKD